MAKKQMFGVGLLPDGRVIRVSKVDVKIMQEITRRVGRKFPPSKDGEPEPTKADISIEMENEMIALCVKGHTARPVEFKFAEVAPSEAEIEKAKKDGAPAPAPRKVVDVAATIAPYIDPESDEFKRWLPLTEMQLSNEEDECSMFTLFSDPLVWSSVIGYINENSGGGLSSNPFAGKLVKTSAG